VIEQRSPLVRRRSAQGRRMVSSLPELIGRNIVIESPLFGKLVGPAAEPFGTLSTLYRVQWLSDDGSIFAAYKTIDIALALNLERCLAEAFHTYGR
jgi:hypothetical protein